MGVDLFDKFGFKLLDLTGAQIHTIEEKDNAYKHLYPSLFIGFGECKSYCHAPRVDLAFPPVSQRLRCLPFAVREEVSTEQKRLESESIIKHID